MMARQVEEVFYAALRVGEGVFYFFDRYDEALLARRHNMSAAALLMEGARRMDEMRFFRERVPNDDYIPAPKASDKQAPRRARRGLRSVRRQAEHRRDRPAHRAARVRGDARGLPAHPGGFVTVAAPRPRGPVAIVEAFNPALVEIHSDATRPARGMSFATRSRGSRPAPLVFDPLFFGAGPRADGSFAAERVAKNLAAVAGEDPDAWLVQLLDEYVGFALFQAGSLLSRESEAALAAQVAEVLKPVRSLNLTTSPPASLRMQ